jgi:4a-hydroxytetrahydrobiopterin dehydratase
MTPWKTLPAWTMARPVQTITEGRPRVPIFPLSKEAAMATATALKEKHCVHCEGGVQALTPERIRQLQQEVPQWQVSEDGKCLRRGWRMENFSAALEFFNAVGKIAEAEDHHPDLHLTGYRNVSIALSTHAIGGLSENDFILAAKINEVPVRVKRG